MLLSTFLQSPFFLLLLYLPTSHGTAVEPSYNHSSHNYREITHPLRTDSQIPACNLTLFNLELHSIAESPVFCRDYSAPVDCSSPWSSAVAELSASISGNQQRRIAAVWIGGVEILRTSTVETSGHGAFWKVRKDLTRYASVLSQARSRVLLTLKSVAAAHVDGNYWTNVPANFRINITLHFYGRQNVTKARKLGFSQQETGGTEKLEEFGFLAEEGVEVVNESGFRPNISPQLGFSSGRKETEELKKHRSGKEGGDEEAKEKADGNFKNMLKLASEGRNGTVHSHFYEIPADLIIPISSKKVSGAVSSFWFTVENPSDMLFSEITIPKNTFKAVLEIYVSCHAEDEFWYLNPPEALGKSSMRTGFHGAFRQVFASVDRLHVGAFVPIPVVYSGGIVPSFWDPIIPFGAFDIPAYDLDLTPFVGLLLDGKPHTFSLGVTDASSLWLVDANLHLWVDPKLPSVTGKLVKYHAPNLTISRQYRIGTTDRKFKIKAARAHLFSGWVNSSFGNISTHIDHELEFRNVIKIRDNGRFKDVSQVIKTENKVESETTSDSLVVKASYENKYPLEFRREIHSKGREEAFGRTHFQREMEERVSLVVPYGSFASSYANRQESEGRLLVHGREVVFENATTIQNYSFKDDIGCFVRTSVGGGGHLFKDTWTDKCVVETGSV